MASNMSVFPSRTFMKNWGQNTASNMGVLVGVFQALDLKHNHVLYYQNVLSNTTLNTGKFNGVFDFSRALWFLYWIGNWYTPLMHTILISIYVI